MTSLLLPRLVPRQRKPLDEASWATLRAVDELLQDKTLPYDTLRGRLNTVPKSQRGVDWAERVVKIYCCKLMKAQRCNALINNIGAIRQANGDTDKHIAFQDTLGRLTAPKILTLHGYTLPLRSMDQPTVIAEIKNLIRLLADLGYQSFINSGTLLGAVREQALLGHDAELAILIEGVDERELVRNFAEIGNALNQTGALAKPAVLSKGSPVTKIELRSGVVLDLFQSGFGMVVRLFGPILLANWVTKMFFRFPRKPLAA